jgi:hypothetical protein
MKESKVKKRLRKNLVSIDGMCENFASPSRRHVPDCLVTWPWGDMDLVETKAPGKKPRKAQAEDHRLRAIIGRHVFVLNTIEKVDAWFRNKVRARGWDLR